MLYFLLHYIKLINLVCFADYVLHQSQSSPFEKCFLSPVRSKKKKKKLIPVIRKMLTIRSDNTITDYAVTENIYKAKSMPRIQFINTSKCTLNLPLIVLLVLSTLHIRFTLYDFWILYTMLSKRIYPAREYLTRQHFSSVIISHKWLHYSHTKELFCFLEQLCFLPGGFRSLTRLFVSITHVVCVCSVASRPFKEKTPTLVFTSQPWKQ